MVKIETSGGPDKPCKSEGSGFIISTTTEKIVIATAKHVIPSASVCVGKMDVIGRFVSDPSVEIPLTIEALGTSDLAFLSVANGATKTGLGTAHLACRLMLGTTAVPLEQLLMLGYFPGDRKPLPKAGYIENEPDEAGTRQPICGTINKGMSGGPVVDRRGLVLGLMRDRMDEDDYDNPVFEKGNILPVRRISDELSKILPPPVGELCYEGSLPAEIASETSQITIPYQLSEIRDDHDSAPLQDIVKWAIDALFGRNPPPLRYANSYRREFNAIAGYKITSIKETLVVSHNFPSEPLPTADCTSPEDCIRISQDGRRLIVDFRLWSGPSLLDQTRGWLDMTIVTEQEKLPAHSKVTPAGP